MKNHQKRSKKDFSILAKKLKRPIIPVAIIGAYKVMPKGSFLLDPRASNIELIIGESIFMKEEETGKEFTERVREWFVEKGL